MRARRFGRLREGEKGGVVVLPMANKNVQWFLPQRTQRNGARVLSNDLLENIKECCVN